MSSLRIALVGALLGGAVPFCWPGAAEASQNADYRHRYPQVWSASVRLLRVDYGLELREQDSDIGYLLFDWRDSNGRAHPGSMELVQAERHEQSVVRVVVRISAMPSYIEQMILDRLQRKLVDEFGQPPAEQRPPRNRGGREEPLEEPEVDGDEPSAEEPDDD